MIDALIGSVMLVAFDWVPDGWAACNGQSMPIMQCQRLFSLIGPKFGGDGINNFNLPNLPEMKDANGNPLTWIICLEGVYPPRK
jgi:microcystin-dependent protein